MKNEKADITKGKWQSAYTSTAFYVASTLLWPVMYNMTQCTRAWPFLRTVPEPEILCFAHNATWLWAKLQYPTTKHAWHLSKTNPTFLEWHVSAHVLSTLLLIHCCIETTATWAELSLFLPTLIPLELNEQDPHLQTKPFPFVSQVKMCHCLIPNNGWWSACNDITEQKHPSYILKAKVLSKFHFTSGTQVQAWWDASSTVSEGLQLGQTLNLDF